MTNLGNILFIYKLTRLIVLILGSFRFRTSLPKRLYKSLCYRLVFIPFYLKSPNIRGFAILEVRGNIFVPYSQTNHTISIYFISMNRRINTKNSDV
jgi:hypothetical protein